MLIGDKSNHEAGFHGSQILYCTVVISSGFGVSLISPSNIGRFFQSIGRNAQSVKGVMFTVGFTIATVLTIWRLSPVHPFMLADNRHYTFYIWRKFFLRHHLAKFLPTPLYLFTGWRCWVELRKFPTEI